MTLIYRYYCIQTRATCKPKNNIISIILHIYPSYPVVCCLLGRLNLPEMPERTSPTRQSARANKHVTQSSFGASSELAASLATFQQGWSQGGSQAMDDVSIR